MKLADIVNQVIFVDWQGLNQMHGTELCGVLIGLLSPMSQKSAYALGGHPTPGY